MQRGDGIVILAIIAILLIFGFHAYGFDNGRNEPTPVRSN